MPVDNTTLLWDIFTYLLGSVLVLGVILLLYLIVMHNILYRKLDPILFKEPWFHPNQLTLFNAWPMSFFKTINYLFLLAYPNYARKRNKRFKNLKDVPIVKSSIIKASKLYISLHITVVSLGIIWALYMISLITLIELGIIK